MTVPSKRRRPLRLPVTVQTVALAAAAAGLSGALGLAVLAWLERSA